jgi:Flp pilus assembly protein TadD
MALRLIPLPAVSKAPRFRGKVLRVCSACAILIATAHTVPLRADDGGVYVRLPAPHAERMRHDALNVLYDRLRMAETEERAAPVMEAIERLWLQSGSATVDLLMERALISMRGKQYDLAVTLLKHVVETAPDYPEGWNQLAVALFRKEDYRAAVLPLQRALLLEPRHYKAVEGLGVLMRELGDKRAALAAYRRALLLNPSSKAARDAAGELAREVEGQRI